MVARRSRRLPDAHDSISAETLAATDPWIHQEIERAAQFFEMVRQANRRKQLRNILRRLDDATDPGCWSYSLVGCCKGGSERERLRLGESSASRRYRPFADGAANSSDRPQA
jgi:hypothetical protein